MSNTNALSAFDKLQAKVHQIEAERAQIVSDQEAIDQARADAKERLKDLSEQQTELAKQQRSVKEDLSNQDKQYALLEKKRREQDSGYQEIMKEYETSKAERNKKLVSWWMQEYGNFDDMNLHQLKDWLASAVISQRRGDRSSVGNSDNDQLYKAHLKKLAKAQSKDEVQPQDIDDKDVDEDERQLAKADRKSNQKLQDKQRIYTNRQENNPLDTTAEAEDDEELASPLGHEDLDKELDEYANSSAEPTHNLTKEEVAKQFRDEFQL